MLTLHGYLPGIFVIALFTPSSSTDGLPLVTPAGWCGFAGDLLAAQFGSFTDPAIGRKLVRVRSAGRRGVRVETFASGFGRPLALASALHKLHNVGRMLPMSEATPATAHLFIVSPLSGGSLLKLFSTHPPMEERIARLESMQQRSY